MKYLELLTNRVFNRFDFYVVAPAATLLGANSRWWEALAVLLVGALLSILLENL